MLKRPTIIITSLFLMFSKTFAAQDVEPPTQNTELRDFRPFTGKVKGSRVRLRTQPTLEAAIVSQLRNGDLFIIQGETDEFFAVKPPAETKANVHRKFVLDGAIDGERVNVRLNPDLDAPVVATLNTGDAVKGSIRGKWLEIDAPPETRFYVYKDYIEKMGGPEIYLRLEKTREKYRNLLNMASDQIQMAFSRPFEEIEIDQTLSELGKIAADEENFPEYAAEAKEIIRESSEKYLQKKIAYLETLTENPPQEWARQSEELKPKMQTEKANTIATFESHAAPLPKSTEMLYWEPAEATLYEQWASRQDGYANYESFYDNEVTKARVLQGILTKPPQTINNAPGDYILVSERTRMPIAYLYSTRVNLQDSVGRRVTLRGVERDNNHFAFPAYFVLSANE